MDKLTQAHIANLLKFWRQRLLPRLCRGNDEAECCLRAYFWLVPPRMAWQGPKLTVQEARKRFREDHCKIADLNPESGLSTSEFHQKLKEELSYLTPCLAYEALGWLAKDTGEAVAAIELYFPGAMVDPNLLLFPEEYVIYLRKYSGSQVARQFRKFGTYVETSRQRARITLRKEAFPPERYGLASHPPTDKEDDSAASTNSLASPQGSSRASRANSTSGNSALTTKGTTDSIRKSSFSQSTQTSLSPGGNSTLVVYLPPPPSTVGSTTWASIAPVAAPLLPQ
jgi:hypothetical protein